MQKVETFAYDGKFRRTRGDGGGGGCLSPLPEELILFMYFGCYFNTVCAIQIPGDNPLGPGLNRVGDPVSQ